jgi:DNA (cytosine-5)-methyltransferase 1
MTQDPIFLIVDLFCGAGGTTTGFVQAALDGNPVAKVIACVNHDHKAIMSHWANHPEVKHFEEDIRTLDLTELTKIVKTEQDKYPDAYLILWASLECTNFSKAKGGQPRDADSRTLADHLERYITAIQPDYVQIENVVEFMSWGPLDENGKPVSRKNGSDWMRWCREICGMGYSNEWKELNSANFGAYTSRNRLFGVFAKEGLPVAWPAPTHAKVPSKFSMHGDLQKWKAVKDVLNFEDEGESILTRKKPLSDKTLERIMAGLIKYVAKGDSAFISKYFSGLNSVEDPCPTNTTFGGNSLVQAQFLLKYNSMDKSGKHTPPSIEDPCPVIPAQGRLGLISPEFLAAYYGNGDNVSSVENPCPTVPTKDRFGLVKPEYFIDDQPAGYILPTDEEPAPTIQATRRHHYIVNPSHGGHSTSTEAPCPVIVARQDKAPLYVVVCEGGPVSVEVYDGDSVVMIKIKQFMAIYGLVDIKMRMLRVTELLNIQGFPAGYKLEGNQSDQKKFIGNSVVPHVVKAWTEAMAQRIIDNRKVKVA